MSGARFNYDYGQKRNWRRWQWNRIVERLSVKPQDAVVVYLAGKDDHDREVAIDRGFKEYNLIAVEKSLRPFRELRKAGRLAVRGDLFDVLCFWPPERKIDAVVADLCCGLEQRVIATLCMCVTCPHLENAVFSFNLLRGRDPSSNWFRQCNHDAGVAQDDVRHRGKMAFAAWFTQAFCFGMGLTRLNPKNWELEPVGRMDISAPAMQKEWFAVQKWCMPAYNSYKSESGQVFDSVVWRSPMYLRFQQWGAIRHSLVGLYKSANHADSVRKHRRHIAAILAHRTMRQRMNGPYV